MKALVKIHDVLRDQSVRPHTKSVIQVGNARVFVFKGAPLENGPRGPAHAFEVHGPHAQLIAKILGHHFDAFVSAIGA